MNGLPKGIARGEAEKANREIGQRQQKADREIAEELAAKEAEKEEAKAKGMAKGRAEKKQNRGRTSYSATSATRIPAIGARS